MNTDTRLALRVSRVTVAGNLALVAVKLAAGLLARSEALVSDAVHSASDVLSTVIVMVGVKMSAKSSDREHPYGHERLECVAALLLSMVLFATGLAVGYRGVLRLASGEALSVPGFAALPAAALSIVTKEAMFRYTRRYARLLDSPALLADAWHHRSDALSSVGALIGVAGARLGAPQMDAFASLVICVFIGKAALDIFRDAVEKLVDHSCDPDTEDAIRARVRSDPGVARVDLLRTREFGSRIYIELEISVDGSLSLTEAHTIAERVHNDVESAFPKVKHIMIHVNPWEPDNT